MRDIFLRIQYKQLILNDLNLLFKLFVNFDLIIEFINLINIGIVSY